MKRHALSAFAALALFTVGCAGSTEEPTEDADPGAKKEPLPAVSVTGTIAPQQRVFHRLCIQRPDGTEVVSVNTCLWWWSDE